MMMISCKWKKMKTFIFYRLIFVLIQIFNGSYYFTLAFENSDCIDYVTEKVYHLRELIVPIILNQNILRGIHEKLNPYVIALSDFKSIKDLADYLNYLMDNKKEYLKYFEWTKIHTKTRSKYTTKNFGCEVCKIARKQKAGFQKQNTWEMMNTDDFSFSTCEWKPRTLTELYASDSKEIVRIYADGVYDLFHPGHVEQFKQVKAAFPNVYLIIGVCSDADTLKYKGCLPVMNEGERQKMINQCRYVDEIYISPPFFPTIEFVNNLKADLVAHDSLPYNSPTTDDCYAIFKACDRFLETQRTPAISTTSLLNRIIDDLERFKKRQTTRTTLSV